MAAVVVGNRKQLTSLLLLCIISSAAIPAWAEAAQVMCNFVVTELTPCVDYIVDGGAIPAACCGSLRTLVGSLKTTQDRQSACKCFRRLVSDLTLEQLKRAQSLPGYCKAPFPFTISPTFDCSKVPKIIN